MSSPKNPDWVIQANQEGLHFDLESVVPLDFDALVNTAMRKSGQIYASRY